MGNPKNTGSKSIGNVFFSRMQKMRGLARKNPKSKSTDASSDSGVCGILELGSSEATPDPNLNANANPKQKSNLKTALNTVSTAAAAAASITKESMSKGVELGAKTSATIKQGLSDAGAAISQFASATSKSAQSTVSKARAAMPFGTPKTPVIPSKPAYMTAAPKYKLKVLAQEPKYAAYVRMIPDGSSRDEVMAAIKRDNQLTEQEITKLFPPQSLVPGSKHPIPTEESSGQPPPPPPPRNHADSSALDGGRGDLQADSTPLHEAAHISGASQDMMLNSDEDPQYPPATEEQLKQYNNMLKLGFPAEAISTIAKKNQVSLPENFFTKNAAQKKESADADTGTQEPGVNTQITEQFRNIAAAAAAAAAKEKKTQKATTTLDVTNSTLSTTESTTDMKRKDSLTPEDLDGHSETNLTTQADSEEELRNKLNSGNPDAPGSEDHNPSHETHTTHTTPQQTAPTQPTVDPKQATFAAYVKRMRDFGKSEGLPDGYTVTPYFGVAAMARTTWNRKSLDFYGSDNSSKKVQKLFTSREDKGAIYRDDVDPKADMKAAFIAMMHKANLETKNLGATCTFTINGINATNVIAFQNALAAVFTDNQTKYVKLAFDINSQNAIKQHLCNNDERKFQVFMSAFQRVAQPIPATSANVSAELIATPPTLPQKPTHMKPGGV